MADLGQRLRQARLDAGLSQRQLCGDVITRNMLSQIENGTARPSTDTLQYLAGRLGKSVSWFLEDAPLESANTAVMDAARAAFRREDFEAVRDAFSNFQAPDPVFSREKALLEYIALLELAKKALEENRRLYALDLLAEARDAGLASGGERLGERQRLLLLAQASPSNLAGICRELPSLDGELKIRAMAAMESGDFSRAAALLEAMEEKNAPQWQLLRGKTALEQGDPAGAAAFLHPVEDTFPEALPLLERCFRETQDFRRAYEYACKQRT